MALNVGDKFKVIRATPPIKDIYLGETFTVRNVNPNGDEAFNGETNYSVNEECIFVFLESEIEPVATSPIKRVIYNDPATIILWDDGTKTIAKCMEGDTYDREKGFVIAYLKKMIGNTTFRDELIKWCEVEEDKTEWRVVDRPVRAGDYIRLITPMFTFNKIGDIMKVFYANNDYVTVRNIDHVRPTGHDVNDDYEWGYLKGAFEVVEKVNRKETNEPLTTEQLMKMDGQKVWVSSLDLDGEIFDNKYCGWYTVNAKNQQLIDTRPPHEYYRICMEGALYGFRAYRECPIKT